MAKKKPGKWDDILEELPKSFGQDPKRQEKINAIKFEIKRKAAEEGVTLSSAALTRRYGKVRYDEDVANAELHRIGLERDAYEQLLSETHENEGIKRTVLADGEAVSTFREPRAKVVDQDALRKWCIENGYETKLQLLWATLNSITKERLEAGEEEPDGVVAEGVIKVRYNKPGTADKSDDEKSIADIFESGEDPVKL